MTSSWHTNKLYENTFFSKHKIEKIKVDKYVEIKFFVFDDTFVIRSELLLSD